MKNIRTPKWATLALMTALAATTLSTTTGCRSLWNAFAVWTWFADLTPHQVEGHYQQGLALLETNPDHAYQHLHIAALHNHSSALVKRNQQEQTMTLHKISLQRHRAEAHPLYLN